MAPPPPPPPPRRGSVGDVGGRAARTVARSPWPLSRGLGCRHNHTTPDSCGVAETAICQRCYFVNARDGMGWNCTNHRHQELNCRRLSAVLIDLIVHTTSDVNFLNIKYGISKAVSCTYGRWLLSSLEQKTQLTHCMILARSDGHVIQDCSQRYAKAN